MASIHHIEVLLLFDCVIDIIIFFLSLPRHIDNVCVSTKIKEVLWLGPIDSLKSPSNSIHPLTLFNLSGIFPIQHRCPTIATQ